MPPSPPPDERLTSSSSATLFPPGEFYSNPSLPVPLTPFIERERESAIALELLQQERIRLLTLTGPGGVGKTRLALHIADKLKDEYADGVYFVALSSTRDPALVVPLIAQAHGMREGAGLSSSDVLHTFLRSRSELIILDNFEQVVEAAPQIAHLLGQCPNITVLVTSQVALHIQGEQELSVLPMSLPQRAAGMTWRTPSLDELAQFESIELFVQRARSVQPDFELTDANSLAVVEICRRLDGLPLAIELAAARIKFLSPAALLSRMASSLQVLTSRSRDLPERLRTMRSAIGWSYDLLDSREQVFMRQLSVFSSGFTLEAAGYVCGIQDSEFELIDSIASLVDKSLLMTIDSPTDEPRFLMLETITEFGIEQLEEHGELELIRQHHADWCVQLVSYASQKLNGHDAVLWIERLELEHNNIRAALSWAIESDQPEIALTIGTDLWLFWFQRGYFTEGSTWLANAIALRPSDSTPLIANALTVSGLLIEATGDLDLARTRLDASLAMANELGDQRSIAIATFGLADLIDSLGQSEASNVLAYDAVRLLREIDEPTWLVVALLLLSVQIHWQGETELAEQIMDEGLDLARQIGFGWGIALSLSHLGRFARDKGNTQQALDLFQESLAGWQKYGDPWRILRLLMFIADLAASAGRPDTSARLLGAAERLNESISAAIYVADEAIYHRAVAEIRAALPPAELADFWAEGRKMSRDEAIAMALAVSLEHIPRPTPGAYELESGHKLTPRELEVLEGLVAGNSDREIAETLFISPRTVQSHVNNIFTKLNVNSRTAAATVALRLNLVEDPATTI